MDKNTNNEKLKEEEVFRQEVSAEELDDVAGGGWPGDHDDNCTEIWYRDIHGAGCAATVGNGSHCHRNDACYDTAVEYYNIQGCDWVIDCSKARD